MQVITKNEPQTGIVEYVDNDIQRNGTPVETPMQRECKFKEKLIRRKYNLRQTYVTMIVMPIPKCHMLKCRPILKLQCPREQCMTRQYFRMLKFTFPPVPFLL